MRKERVRVLAAMVTTREKEEGQWSELTVGRAAMTPREAGRSILSSFLGNPPMLSKKTSYHQCDRADNNGMSVRGVDCTMWAHGRQ